jgi:electron transfer flavoprotein alpha subunit
MVQNEQLVAFRRVYDGRFQVTVGLRDSAPFLATLTPRLAEYPPVAASARRRMAKVVMVPVNLAESRVRPLRLMPGDPRALDLREADVIVAGGRGIGSRENLQLLNELADAMQGVVACSRPLVDAGWLPRDRLVGQSGRQVAPRLYIACGISGATQHLMGMRGSQFVVAINSDPHSPIFKAADVGVVGDLGQVIPALTRKALEARRAGLAPAEAMGTSLAEG